MYRRAGRQPAEVPAGPGGQRPAPLHSRPPAQNAVTTLWNTGARISEALALTKGDFLLRQYNLFVELATLKQREEKAEPRASRLPHRMVPVSDAQFVSQLKMMVATLRIPLEKWNETTGRTEVVRLWASPIASRASG